MSRLELRLLFWSGLGKHNEEQGCPGPPRAGGTGEVVKWDGRKWAEPLKEKGHLSQQTSISRALPGAPHCSSWVHLCVPMPAGSSPGVTPGPGSSFLWLLRIRLVLC